MTNIGYILVGFATLLVAYPARLLGFAVGIVYTCFTEGLAKGRNF